MEQYTLLNEISQIIFEDYSASYNIIDKYNKENVISRTDVIKEFGGENLKKILNELNFSGDTQKGIDTLVRDILLFVSDYSLDDFVIDEISCHQPTDKCFVNEDNKRKSCDKREYTTGCKTLILRKI
jgi:hypothetical protein